MTSGEEEKRKPMQHSASHVFPFFPAPLLSPLILLSLFCGAREREREKREAKKRHFSLFSFHFPAKVEGGGGGFKPPTPFFPFRLSRLRIIGVRWKSPNHHLPPYMLCRNGGGGIFSFLFFSSFPPFPYPGSIARICCLPPNKKTGWCVIMPPL